MSSFHKKIKWIIHTKDSWDICGEFTEWLKINFVFQKMADWVRFPLFNTQALHSFPDDWLITARFPKTKNWQNNFFRTVIISDSLLGGTIKLLFVHIRRVEIFSDFGSKTLFMAQILHQNKSQDITNILITKL